MAGTAEINLIVGAVQGHVRSPAWPEGGTARSTFAFSFGDCPMPAARPPEANGGTPQCPTAQCACLRNEQALVAL